MDHLTDYALWMKDAPLGDSIGEVDAMVLCYLSYADLSGILQPGDEMTLREAVERMDVKENIPCLIVTDDPHYSERVRMIASTRRYGELILSGYTDEHDTEKDLQFCAMVFRSPDWSFIVFRGTDQTLVGWKEDFIMSFTVMPSQVRAAEYARERIGKGKWYLGGHSKGGNLALYAACALDGERLASVERVFLLDSPGLCREGLEESDVDPNAAYDKLVRIIPEYDVVGGLFAPKSPRQIIVRSEAEGLMQHDMATWGVEHGELMTAPQQDPMSLLLVEAVGRWLEGKDRAQREEFVDSLFGEMQKGGRRTLGELNAEGLLGYESIVIGLIRRHDGGEELGRLPMKTNLTRAADRVTEAIGRLTGAREGIIQCLLLIVLGGAVFLVNEHLLETAAGIFLSGAAVVQDVWTVRKVIRCRKNPKEAMPYIYLSLFVTVMVLCMLFKENAAFLLGSIGVSVCLLAMGMHCLRLFAGKIKKGFYRWIRLPEALILFVFAVIYLVVSKPGAAQVSVVFGAIMMADGLIRLVRILLGTVLEK